MTEPERLQTISPEIPDPHSLSATHSLRALIEQVTGADHPMDAAYASEKRDSGIVEVLPFPFLAMVGQTEMKTALLLALINPAVGGVLLIGPRGTGKTTAVRSLVDLLPQVSRSLCYYGCMPEDVETGGIDAICPDCAKKYALGESLAAMDRVRLVELPLNARLEDVIGGIDERAAIHERLRLRRGILAQADRNLLYVDEVNLLGSQVADAILDAAAQGSYTIRRGPIWATYRSRFVLTGSMNPEEGHLRPQILDRFGLRVIVRGLLDSRDRLEAYQRVHTYQDQPHEIIQRYASATMQARDEIQSARDRLSQVEITPEIAQVGLEMIEKLQIDSLRAEITLFEAARAYAVSDDRTLVSREDLYQVGPMALRFRRSKFMTEYLTQQSIEENEISMIINPEYPFKHP